MSREVEDAYRIIDAIPPNSEPLLLSIDHDPAAVGELWAIYPGSRYGLTVLGGLTAVHVADVQPFYQSGQIKGLLGGLKGPAEYEQRIGHPGDGMSGMRPQKVVHYLIILFIALDDVAFLLARKRQT